ncbi:MAG: glutamine-hydrolyzing carbamoyl-phosphate synthase small subunit [Thermoplasmata archaeon]|jgi:carbamoyl-phosphate synthase small subunit|nr:glutamine-hydrolyzing carbamoyl-phosphate synthase small subunit [Thermoplasmata archaeon]MVT14166.1 glutamine-hydrolyzing carbamoyl-phosphate synthase small subunit [Euryarchaeota archaeon]MVT36378.1 glutamine-hydrolyzing carbamoyl-phosphate synthase small subunit [Euryarchaeota archaeon]
MDGFLLTEDGQVYRGKIIGKEKPSFGETVFTTSMTGYTESITDPSYAGQILVFSFPLLGNYGISWSHRESEKIWVRGIVASEIYDTPRNRYTISNLEDFLRLGNVPGIVNVDTRKLIRRIRQNGTLLGIIYPGDPDKMLREAKITLEEMHHPMEDPLFKETASKEIKFLKGAGNLKIALIDFGVKNGILDNLLTIGDVTIIPYFMRVFIDNFDAVVISNGPGDPTHKSLEDTVDFIRSIKKPILGICLGHQLLARVFGAKIYKMKFGHRGVNHPVRYNDRFYITTHNHGYAVSRNAPDNIIINQYDINDGTVEGFVHRDLPIMAVQYHPESRPGTHDAKFIFSEFERMVKENERP